MRPVPAVFLAALVACLATGARAASFEYALSVEDGLPATFEVPIHVDYAGTVTIEATWRGPRPMFFGLDGARGEPVAHRAGPSPERFDVVVDASLLAKGADFKLTIKALPTRGTIEGTVRVVVPDSPEVVARREAELHPPPPPPPPPPAWTLVTAPPPGATREVALVFEATEGFRRIVLADGAPPDACGWQRDFLRFAAVSRDRLAALGAAPDTPSLRYFARLAAAVRVVEGLRASKDPALAGPVPADRDARRDWLIARAEVTRPIEHELDELSELLRGGHAPALEGQEWIPRFNACLTSCERYFDERDRVGNQGVAGNREVAEAQWSRILAAARVFESYAPFHTEPPAPEAAESGRPSPP